MVNASLKSYNNYSDFITDFLFVVLAEGNASIIAQYEDTIGIIQSLNEKVINGNSLCLTPECFDNIDNDLLVAKARGGLMIITVLKGGEIITEPLVFTESKAFAETTYYIEYDAKKALDLPLNGCVIPFRITKQKIDSCH